MTIQLEQLIVPLKLDKTDFTKGLSGVTKAASIGFGAIVASAGAVAVGISKAIDMTVKWGDEMDALQDVTDLTNDEAAGLNVLLRKHGVSADTAAKSYTFLNKNLVEFDGQLGSTGKALKNWGIDVKNSNGTMKTNAELTQEMANTYRRLQPGAERVTFLTETFGKSSTELNDALLELADKGLDSFIDRAKKLGLNLDADKVQEYKQANEELKLSWEAIGIFLGSKFMPVAQRATEWITNNAIPAVSDFVQRATTAFEEGGLGGLADFILAELGNLDTEIAGKLDSIDWAGLGVKFGDWVDDQLSKEWGEGNLLPKFVVSLTDGLQDALLHAALGANPEEAWAAFFDNVQREGDSGVRKFFINWELTWTNGIRNSMNNIEVTATNSVRDFFNDWERSWTQGIRSWGISSYNSIVGWFNKIFAKFNEAQSLINITPISTIPSGSGQAKTGRATGGAVLAANAYDTVELSRPEVFTPFTAGRIDPKEPVVVRTDEDRLGKVIVRGFDEVLQKRGF